MRAAVLLLALSCGCAGLKPRAADVLALSAAFGLSALDTAQSIEMQGEPATYRVPGPYGWVSQSGGHRFEETGLARPIFGAHPTAAEFVGLNIASDALVFVAWALLRDHPNLRLAPPLGVALGEGINDFRNWRVSQ